MKGETYPNDFYLIQNEDGTMHWFLEDPYRMTEPERHEKEVHLEKLLVRRYGTPSLHNPLRVRLSCAMYMRAEKFTALHLTRIRSGRYGRHIEDAEGSYVQIEDTQDETNTRFPFIGFIVDLEGTVLAGRRNYSLDGECEDRDPRHRLLVVRNSREYAALHEDISYDDYVREEMERRRAQAREAEANGRRPGRP